jgi:hypothetical protein
MRGYLKDHVGVFDPNDVVILLAAFDKAWEAVRASGVRYPADKVEICAGDTRETHYCGRNERRAGPRPAARRRSTRLGSIKSAERVCEPTRLAESSLCREPDRRCACYLVGAEREAETWGATHAPSRRPS